MARRLRLVERARQVLPALLGQRGLLDRKALLVLQEPPDRLGRRVRRERLGQLVLRERLAHGDRFGIPAPARQARLRACLLMTSIWMGRAEMFIRTPGLHGR